MPSRRWVQDEPSWHRPLNTHFGGCFLVWMFRVLRVGSLALSISQHLDAQSRKGNLTHGALFLYCGLAFGWPRVAGRAALVGFLTFLLFSGLARMHSNRSLFYRFTHDPALRVGALIALLLLLLNTLSVTSALVWDDEAALRGHAAWHLLLAPYAIDPAAYWRPLGVFLMEAPLLLGASVWIDKAISPLLWFVGVCGALQLSAIVWPWDEGPAGKETLRTRGLAFALIALLMGSLAMSAEPQFWLSSRFDVLLCALAPWAAARIELRFQAALLAKHGAAKAQSWIGAGLEGAVWALLLGGAKETGAVWAVVFIAWALWRARACEPDRKVLLALAGGLVLGLVGWWLARHAQLSHTANLAELVGRRGGLPWSTRAGLFAQGIWRSILSFGVPVADLSPLKAAWVGSASRSGPAMLWSGVLVLVLSLGALLLCTAQSLPRSKAIQASSAAWVALGASLALVLFHGALAAVAEQSNGALLADRYLAPSALLLAPGIALALRWGVSQLSDHHRGGAPHVGLQSQGIAIAIWITVVLVFMMQVLAWGAAREAWKDSAHLWARAQEKAPQVKLANINDAMALNAIGAHQQALDVATQWIAHQGGDQLENCKLHSAAMNALLALGRDSEALTLARRAQPFAWCDGSLALSTASLLLQANECPAALTLLERSDEEGQGGPQSHQFWSFPNAEARTQLLSREAFAQAHCGSQAAANHTLDTMAKLDAHWAAGSPLRASLLSQAQVKH